MEWLVYVDSELQTLMIVLWILWTYQVDCGAVATIHFDG